MKLMYVSTLLAIFAFSIQLNADLKVPAQKLKAKLPKAKPNLTITALGWERELCPGTCAQVKRDLKIYKSKCRLLVQVANLGSVPSGRFSVQVQYTHWKGQATLQLVKHVGTGLAGKNKGTWKRNLYFDLGYYRVDRPIKVIIDYKNQVKESKESDNTKSIRLN